MRLALLIVLVLLAALAMAQLLGMWRLARLQNGLVRAITGGPVATATRADLPPIVAAFAERNGGGGSGQRYVHLTQEAEMILAPRPDWQPMNAQQWIGLGTAGFLWRADLAGVGPFARVVVIDAYTGGEGRLAARLFGSVPVADMQSGVLDRSEAMRYLAELPWVPDAILHNPDLVWRQIGPDQVSVSLAVGAEVAAVTFTFDSAGDIAFVEAPDRPATSPDGTVIARPWYGRFWDYDRIGGRRIPLRGEVGYGTADSHELYWRGTVTGYSLHP
ncbi:hypothetical protein KUH32_03355 [Thalassococcus sp. CAU 1522]|uniref:DUF4178 domain-containing protein n=1 Tax=Thalassococcus arenae TaxID=2851652 RepID=A0ABS6N456_9RHOB|nr:DUF6544 family protein [Thalassococcus arenae]MBV2358799.1 hypothetical protein [Thalassococcus arenae]